jgi:hypothetical protein
MAMMHYYLQGLIKMDPFTMMAAGGAVVGGLVQAQGQMEAAEAQAQELRRQQSLAYLNASMQEQQANTIMGETASAVNLQNRRANTTISKQKARQAQSGYFGQTADSMLDQSAANAELDRLNIIYQGQSAATGQRRQAAYSRYQGDMIGAQVQPTLNAGYTQAGGTILQTFGQGSFLAGKNPVDPYMSWGKM